MNQLYVAEVTRAPLMVKKRWGLRVCFCLDLSILSLSRLAESCLPFTCPSHQQQEHGCAMTSELGRKQCCLLSRAGKVLICVGRWLFLCKVAGGAALRVGV